MPRAHEMELVAWHASMKWRSIRQKLLQVGGRVFRKKPLAIRNCALSVDATMSEPREFKNPFPKFEKREHEQEFWDSSERKLTEDVEQHLLSVGLQLCKQLEERMPNECDYKDNSVYTGTAGIALLYFHLSQVYADKQTEFMQKALQLMEKSLSRLSGRRYTFLCGDAGPLAIGAVLYHHAGMTSDSQELVQKLQKLSKHVISLGSDIPDELLYGRAGYLYALLFVQKFISKESISQDVISQVIKSIIHSGKKMSHSQRSPSPLMYAWHGKYYLGAAHGLAGILYMLLEARSYLSSDELHSLVRPSVDFLLALRFSSGNFPSSLGSSTDRLIHWCHGAPGVIHLMAMAYEVFKDKKYLDVAKKCGDVIWSRGLLRKGYGICHGVAGNAYAFLRLYHLTDEEKYVYEAVKFAEWCSDYGKHGCRIPDHPLSLFEGLAGTVYFLADLLRPDKAAFPAFQLDTHLT